MKTSYYTLLVKFEEADPWTAQFGDYDKSAVEDERDDSYEDAYCTKIIRTADSQSAIDAAVATLNA